MNAAHLFLVRFPIALLALLCTSAALAAAPLVDARLTVALIQFNGPVESVGPATAAKPGDVLEYTARYSNRGNAAADALMPTMPIPVGTEYVPSAAAPKPAEASLDAITYRPIPLRRKQVDASGATHEVDVPLSEYRALRWSVGSLAAGTDITIRARVRVAQQPTIATR